MNNSFPEFFLSHDLIHNSQVKNSHFTMTFFGFSFSPKFYNNRALFFLYSDRQKSCRTKAHVCSFMCIWCWGSKHPEHTDKELCKEVSNPGDFSASIAPSRVWAGPKMTQFQCSPSHMTSTKYVLGEIPLIWESSSSYLVSVLSYELTLAEDMAKSWRIYTLQRFLMHLNKVCFITK